MKKAKIFNSFEFPKLGFTLSEVLIAITVIGVISSITIPVIQAHFRKREVEIRLEQVYSILNNALTMAVSVHGPVYTWDEMSMTPDSQSAAFFDKYLAPHLIFAKGRDKYDMEELGYNGIKRPNGTLYLANSKRNMAVLNNGACINAFGGWLFTMNDGTKKYYAVQYLVDVNGSKGHNTIGKDIFHFKLILISDRQQFDLAGNTQEKIYFSTGKTTITPTPVDEIIANCEDEGIYCGALIQRNSWQVPDDYPLKM